MLHIALVITLLSAGMPLKSHMSPAPQHTTTIQGKKKNVGQNRSKSATVAPCSWQPGAVTVQKLTSPCRLQKPASPKHTMVPTGSEPDFALEGEISNM